MLYVLNGAGVKFVVEKCKTFFESYYWFDFFYVRADGGIGTLVNNPLKFIWHLIEKNKKNALKAEIKPLEKESNKKKREMKSAKKRKVSRNKFVNPEGLLVDQSELKEIEE